DDTADIAARAEAATLPGDRDDANLDRVLERAERRCELTIDLERERVQFVGTVKRDRGDTAPDLELERRRCERHRWSPSGRLATLARRASRQLTARRTRHHDVALVQGRPDFVEQARERRELRPRQPFEHLAHAARVATLGLAERARSLRREVNAPR